MRAISCPATPWRTASSNSDLDIDSYLSIVLSADALRTLRERRIRVAEQADHAGGQLAKQRRGAHRRGNSRRTGELHQDRPRRVHEPDQYPGHGRRVRAEELG